MATRRGYTLVEVVVAMLLSAVMVTSVFTIALSSKRSGLKADSTVEANAASQTVAKTLSRFITADWTQSTVPGPNSRGTNSWSLDGQDYVDVGRSGAWALAPGSHTITGVAAGLDPEGLLPRLRGSPLTGTLVYCVQWIGCTRCNPPFGSNSANCAPGSCTPPLGDTCQPTITIQVNWSQP